MDASFIQQCSWSRDGWCPRQTRPLGGDTALPRVCNTTHPGQWHPAAAGWQLRETGFWKWTRTLCSFHLVLPHRPPPSWALCTEKQCCKEEAGLYLLTLQGGRPMATAAEPQGSCPRPTPARTARASALEAPGTLLGVPRVPSPPPSLTPGGGFLPSYCLRCTRLDNAMLWGTGPCPPAQEQAGGSDDFNKKQAGAEVKFKLPPVLISHQLADTAMQGQRLGHRQWCLLSHLSF